MIMKIKCWAKFFSLYLFFLLACSRIEAIMNPVKLPAPNSHVSEGVYTSTTTTVTGVFFISTYSATLYNFVITAYGSSDASFQYFDASVSTTNQKEITTQVDASSATKIDVDGPYNITSSSGIAIVVNGTTPPRVTTIFRVR